MQFYSVGPGSRRGPPLRWWPRHAIAGWSP